ASVEPSDAHWRTDPRIAGPACVLLATLVVIVTLDAAALRHDWTIPDIEAIYTAPLPDLVFRAQTVHRQHHRANEVQGCMLLSIKTGGCPEDCAYCPQSAHYSTGVTRTDLLTVAEVTKAAADARDHGATRFC